MVKVGYAEGTCSVCGHVIKRQRPADYAVCDCWEYCPFDHGRGPYGTKMTPYTPDLTPTTYESEKGLRVVMVCNLHDPPYYSTQLPVEVTLI